jgi:hypothetical protein
MEQPYSAADVDRMLTAFTQALRCDLLRARWRTGAPEVTWDVSRPAPWYQSFGLRLRDELARLDAVNGAPGSPRTVARLELRAEPTADLRVLRVVVRVAANAPDKEAAPSKPVIWHQSYYLAPGPTEVADPVSLTARAPPGPPVAATTPDPLPALRDPPRFSPPARDEPPAQRVRPVGPSPDQVAPARPVRPQLPDVMVGPFRAVKVGIANTCGHGTPSIQDSGASADDGPLHTGDCLVLELAAVIGQQLFVLHQTAGGSLTRVAPSACVSTPPRGAWHGAFRVPAAGPGSAVIQLTPPAGAETFLAIVMDRTVDSNTRAALAALPDTCGGTVTADALPAAQFVLDALAAEVRQGRAAMRTLTLVHTEAPAHEPADPFVQR